MESCSIIIVRYMYAGVLQTSTELYPYSAVSPESLCIPPPSATVPGHMFSIITTPSRGLVLSAYTPPSQGPSPCTLFIPVSTSHNGRIRVLDDGCRVLSLQDGDCCKFSWKIASDVKAQDVARGPETDLLVVYDGCTV